MTPPWVLRVFRTARYHRLYREIFFNEKDDLLEKDGLLLEQLTLAKN